MTSHTYTHARNNLASVMKEADENREPIVITRNGHAPVVMISMEEFESMSETLHLMSSPKNRERLNQGLKDYADENFVNGKLVDA
ncbi:type II toxin-antitoxin system Phd/YefM family antitoxin [Akkermansiaceae bacterium]|nr:type II toxin-antitoxin system Phd/YefM family antitoxin [Akkermansiaceae bacterium]MDB4272566.1 type II toxin-antitoxin system Phd/YefM family antitoxin [bacterium]MDB4332392.1 type II toxin-antitoxin system Phd/YefM family antitoxin [Akkermansiaceae bacterium]MDB4615392.1 type II toxin-antitoxin system Phd/YefM family antitoxin [Akkermansiaceae bacterium]MDB4668025.1 type II toxin-antitoxin system Phd/YefM family antitoxin [Akkermansiaceae bacterium]